MGSRERKRAARQKRKTRSAERQSGQEAAGETIAAGGSSNGADAEGDLTARAESESERKDREAREALEPLEEGERPTIVTVSAVICTILVALAIAGYALWDVLRDQPRPQLVGVIAFIATIGAMAYGLWRTRYWAVLGFQAALVLVIISNAISLVAALSVYQAIGNVVLLVASGALFWFMIKAWARIEMPTRVPGE